MLVLFRDHEEGRDEGENDTKGYGDEGGGGDSLPFWSLV